MNNSAATSTHKGSKVITINEKINLTKNQYEVLNMICNSYEKCISEYMQEALVEAMQSDIEDGDFCDVLLDKLDEDDKKKKNNSPSPPPASNTIDSDLNILKKLQTKLA